MDLDLDFSGELSLLGDIDVIADAPDTDNERKHEKSERGRRKERKEDPNKDKSIQIHRRRGLRDITRKLASEATVEQALDTWHFQPGECYHCFSFGDVDSLTYFKMVLRQQHIKYACISTWCMAGEDVLDLEKWHDKGMLDRVDFFVGEIFKGSYSEVYDKLQQFIQKEHGRMVVFRNHSKVMAIKGDRFDCVIESSANINTNPRSENTVITIDTELTDFYVKLFGEIIPFNKDFGADPYVI